MRLWRQIYYRSNEYAAGIARSGAYNRTLTPFGFQSEERNLVMLPKKSHGYSAKESVLHLLWEQNQWLEKYVKNKNQPETVLEKTTTELKN